MIAEVEVLDEVGVVMVHNARIDLELLDGLQLRYVDLFRLQDVLVVR